jgi:hypothetical protein
MNYAEAVAMLTGRCKTRRRLDNNTYLWRDSEDSSVVAIRLHATDILEFKQNGSIKVNTGGWNTVTTRDRLNRYLPRPWHVYSERGAMILSNYSYWAESKPKGGIELVLDNRTTILPNGLVYGGRNAQEYRDEIRLQENANRQEANRLHYWLRAARGIYRDKSNCTGKGFRCNCHPRPFRQPRERFTEAGECQLCGCKFIRKSYRGRLTVTEILNEANISVRMAKIHAFGFEKFMLEAKVKVLDRHNDYELLTLPLDDWNSMRALKMRCPSTDAVYVSPVDPRCESVPAALDWMFDTENYLETVSQQA